MNAALFPPIPGPDALHPLVIHFPVALLLVSPLFLLLAMIMPRRAPALGWTALILMALGTLGIFAATWSGERAAELADRTPQVSAILERHEDLAEAAQATFTTLTLLYAALLVAAAYLPVMSRRAIRLPVQATFLLAFLAAAVLLANTAHQGGRLVHQFGVHAMMPPSPPERLAASD